MLMCLGLVLERLQMHWCSGSCVRACVWGGGVAFGVPELMEHSETGSQDTVPGFEGHEDIQE